MTRWVRRSRQSRPGRGTASDRVRALRHLLSGAATRPGCGSHPCGEIASLSPGVQCSPGEPGWVGRAQSGHRRGVVGPRFGEPGPVGDRVGGIGAACRRSVGAGRDGTAPGSDDVVDPAWVGEADRQQDGKHDGQDGQDGQDSGRRRRRRCIGRSGRRRRRGWRPRRADRARRRSTGRPRPRWRRPKAGPGRGQPRPAASAAMAASTAARSTTDSRNRNPPPRSWSRREAEHDDRGHRCQTGQPRAGATACLPRGLTPHPPAAARPG